MMVRLAGLSAIQQGLLTTTYHLYHQVLNGIMQTRSKQSPPKLIAEVIKMNILPDLEFELESAEIERKRFIVRLEEELDDVKEYHTYAQNSLKQYLNYECGATALCNYSRIAETANRLIWLHGRLCGIDNIIDMLRKLISESKLKTGGLR